MYGVKDLIIIFVAMVIGGGIVFYNYPSFEGNKKLLCEPIEIIKEMPVEIEKIVIKEVPVEKIIIKNVPIEKIVIKEVMIPQACDVSTTTSPICYDCWDEKVEIVRLQNEVAALKSYQGKAQNIIAALERRIYDLTGKWPQYGDVLK